VVSKSVLVTGGAGYVGSHACKALAAAGYLPVTFDNLERGHADAVKWGPLVVGDLRDPGAIQLALTEHRPSAVLHFAAYAYVGESVQRPADYYANNVFGTANLVIACLDLGVANLVFSSSCATYGFGSSRPMTEQTPQRPINPYGWTKLSGEHLISHVGGTQGLSFAILRYFNAAGADGEGDLAERHDPEPHLIPRIIQAASGTLPYLDVFGRDYETPDGTCIRDYVHVTDLAQGHVRALDHLLSGGQNLILNLGSGEGHSVMELIGTVEELLGRKVPLRFGPRRAGDPAAFVADPTRARQLIGFDTPHSGIREIVATAARGFGLEVDQAVTA